MPIMLVTSAYYAQPCFCSTVETREAKKITQDITSHDDQAMTNTVGHLTAKSVVVHCLQIDNKLPAVILYSVYANQFFLS